MSNNDYNNSEDFDSIFEQTPPEPTLSAAQRREMEKIASETMIRGYQALQAGQAQVQQMTAEAYRKTEEAHPRFIKRYQDPETCRKFIEHRPAVARAILTAEAGQGTESLPELLDIFAETTGTYEQPGNRSTEPEKGAPASVLSLQQINRLPLLERHQVIRDLGDRVGDMPIDEADPGNEVFKIERGGK